MPNREDFGTRITRLRQLADLTGRGLDSLAGLPHGHSRQLEKGGRPDVAASTLYKVATVFGVSMHWIYSGEGDEPRAVDVITSVERTRARLARKRRAAA